MPLDFTMLLGASPPAATFVPFEVVPSPFDDCNGMLLDEPPYACRRVATFPMVNRLTPKPSNLKYRSLSESNDLHRLTSTYGASAMATDVFSLADFKRELHLLLEEETQQQNEQKEREQAKAGTSTSTISEETAGVSLEEKTTKDDDDGRIKKKTKKRVAFADDRGFKLTTVRVMTEASDVPPKISQAVIRALLGDQWTDDDEPKPSANWIVNFKQPASDYIAFRHKLDSAFVSVENVLVKNDQCRLVGTVKVKNLSFEKEVFLRLTDNEWKSYFDRSCKYSTNRCGDAYDTFQFDFEIPRDDQTFQRMEFCVCYKINNEQEYWDNCDGKNYEVISEHLRKQRSQTQIGSTTTTSINGHESNNGHDEKEKNGFYGKGVSDLNCSNWTEFASWSDLSTQGPYW